MIHFTNHKQRFSVPHKVFEQGGKAYNSTLLNLVHQKEIDKIPLNLMFCICKYLNNTTGVGNIILDKPTIPTHKWKQKSFDFLNEGIIICKQLKLEGLEQEFRTFKGGLTPNKEDSLSSLNLFSYFSPKEKILSFEERITNANICECLYCKAEFRKFQTVDNICSSCIQVYHFK